MRVGKAEMEAPEGDLTAAAAIFTISQKGNLTAGKLYPNLVGAPGVEFDTHQRKIFLSGQNAILQAGLFNATAHTVYNKGLIAGFVVEQEILIDAGFLGGLTADDAEIFFIKCSLLYRSGQNSCGLAGFGIHHNATHSAVQSVDGMERTVKLSSQYLQQVFARS